MVVARNWGVGEMGEIYCDKFLCKNFYGTYIQRIRHRFSRKGRKDPGPWAGRPNLTTTVTRTNEFGLGK